MAKVRPDAVASSGRILDDAGEAFDQTEYKELREHFLTPRVRTDPELAGGMRLRRQRREAIIDGDTPGYKQLKKQIQQLERRRDHRGIYRLLRQLRDSHVYNRSLPPCLLTEKVRGSGGEVVEIIHLDDDDENDDIPEAIDVDTYIIDVLLVDVVKADPDAAPRINSETMMPQDSQARAVKTEPETEPTTGNDESGLAQPPRGANTESEIATAPASTTASTSAEVTSKVQEQRIQDAYGIWGTYSGGINERGEPHGTGTIKFADGDVYEGEWKDGKHEGRGTYWEGNGNVYKGEWKGGKKEGRGTYRYANGDVYEGELKGDKKEGRGMHRWADGTVYEGEYKDGKLEGRGTFRWAGGTVYEGEWKGYKREGRGTYRWTDGEVDIHRYRANAPVGEGVRWGADRRTTHRLIYGGKREQISASEAARIASRIGLPVPD